ncbi:Fic family protein [Candidatus Electrothrix sp.]|uniref:Fic family protein n=1 Tax=Candidatus Electrothrix sp. TaxID=2170559 RepID=UPI0040571862
MKRDLQGSYTTVSTVGEAVQAFIPAPLPPDPPLVWNAELRDKFDRALVALGRLDAVSVLVPDTGLFLYMYVRKEAVLSSQIEGTQSSLSDLLLHEVNRQPGVPLNDVQEVSNYVAALQHGLLRIEEGFPLSLRLLKEMHAVLLSKGRGSQQTPGEFRRSQNWIGGTRPGNACFVPPPADRLIQCMGALEYFLHDQPEKTPSLVKAALAHVQFETIHPFLDGNGRLGRLLITLLLSSEGILHEPLLYLSLYFKSHRQQYYSLLNHVRLTGDWESWLEFFADAIIATAGLAVETARNLAQLAETDRQRINALGRTAGSALRIQQVLLEQPIVSSGQLAEKTALSPATVNSVLLRLEQLGVVTEISGQQRNRLYSYTAYIDLMNQGTETAENHLSSN